MITTTEDVRDEIVHEMSKYGALLRSAVEDQVHLQVRRDQNFIELVQELSARHFYLVTAVGNDERELEDRRYKIYYLFAHPSRYLFVMVEYLLEKNSVAYASIYEQFAAADPFEREMLDMLGLRPKGERALTVAAGSWLHESYPPGLYPLQRTKTTDALMTMVHRQVQPLSAAVPGHVGGSPDTMTLPVGPIHAGVIESGQFIFTIAGETIEDLVIRLGYTHRGIERLFQSHVRLLDGWWLAEQVCGDSSFAHSLAYCRAAETLTDAKVPRPAETLRALFLELERIHNHVADIAGLAEDVGLDQLSAEFAVIREEVLRLDKRLTGHRYLRHVNQPGGVNHSGDLDVHDVRKTLDECLKAFGVLATRMRGAAGFRDRTIRVGVLSQDEARRLGVTGLTARASGVERESRWEHEINVYGQLPLRGADASPPATTDDEREVVAGDVYARFLVRVREVNRAHDTIDRMLERWEAAPAADRTRLLIEPRVMSENNYTSAVGRADGFRGDVVYWLMQDKMNGIYRCKVRDPSLLNWPALRQAVRPRQHHEGGLETMLADFPLVNKSFNLSYAGNDL